MVRAPSLSLPKTLLVCALVLLAAAGITWLVFTTEPRAERGGATKRTAMLVEVVRATRGNYRPELVVTGTVEAEHDVVLRARVSGQVMAHSDKLTPGGFLKKGEVLLRLDPADYHHALQQRQSEVSQAETELQVEMGRQQLAKEEARLIGGDLTDAETKLALRKPQLQAAEARVESAKVALQQARVTLGRTTVTAPFAAQVIEKEVHIGSQVNVGDPLARLVGLETYWVAVSVPRSEVRWLVFPDEAEGQPGSEVRIRNKAAWPQGAERVGHLHQVVGALDKTTRLAKVLVSVPDPLARDADKNDAQALMVGEFVEARIRCKELVNVVRLDRRYLRGNDTVWVMKGRKLQIVEVAVVLTDTGHAYLSEGLNEGDQVVTTNLSTVTKGAELRVQGKKPEG